MIRLATVAAIVLLPTLALAGATPEQKCESAKNKAVGVYSLCLQKAEAKAVKKDEPADTSKCSTNFDKQWNKAEAKWPTCPTLGDGLAIKADVESCMDGISASLSCDVALGGACWYLGAAGDSCDGACADVGLVYDPATAGFGAASADNCNAIMDALGDASTPWVGPPALCIVAGGCYAAAGSRTLCAATSAAQIIGAERACACQ